MNGKIFTGDCLELLRAMADETVGIAYLDPPFSLRAARSQEATAKITPVWKPGEDPIESLLEFLEPRLREVHRVLSPTGSAFVHCDDEAAAYLCVLGDQIFGRRNRRNWLVWKRTNGNNSVSTRCGRILDHILHWNKTNKGTWNGMLQPMSEQNLKTYTAANARLVEKESRRRAKLDHTSALAYEERKAHLVCTVTPDYQGRKAKLDPVDSPASRKVMFNRCDKPDDEGKRRFRRGEPSFTTSTMPTIMRQEKPGSSSAILNGEATSLLPVAVGRPPPRTLTVSTRKEESFSTPREPPSSSTTWMRDPPWRTGRPPPSRP